MAHIMTHDPIRRARWLNLFGTDTLPVTTARPIMIRRGQSERPYYMIDASRLTAIERMRLIGHVWRTRHVSTVAAIAMVDAGVLVDGRNCEVLEEPVEESPALLYGAMYAA